MKTKTILSALLALAIAPLGYAGNEVVSTDPILIEGAVPAYPEAARKLNLEGVVMIEALLTEDGRLMGAEVVESVHPILDAEALAAINTWKFEPATVDGKATWKVVHIPVDYNLKLTPVDSNNLMEHYQTIAKN